ncbi:MAG TPA: alpha/beta fold hydrolase [Steroidobacteraceae bacterium]|nr:alpha/beta fold hydrolase [Steroidobacteraceae bacterium]
MRRSQAWIALIFLWAAGVTTLFAAPPELAACTLPDLEEPARCGELTVPENPDRPDGRKITVAFAVLPATGGPALRDPIVPLFGGPGERTIDEAAYLARQFAGLRRNRDLLLVDQRGVGRSSALNCDLFDPNDPAPNFRDFIPPKAAETCARELSARADLTQYGYLRFAEDLERIRKVLGYSQLNLHAGSYGTRAAQVYMRYFPEGLRTVVLWSVVPPDVVSPLTMAKASQAQFEATFRACEADAACRAAYPNLRKEFDAVLARLEAGKVRAAIPGAAEAVLGRGRAVEWMRSKLYRPRTSADLPWLIHQAHEGDWSPFFEGILEQSKQVDEAYALGLWFSITCSDDVAFLREEDIAPATSGTYLEDYRVRQQQAACRSWPKATLPPGYREPLRSAIPTMFVSGDRDAATPLSFTDRVAPGFSNRVEVVLRGQGHTEWNDCVDRAYVKFVESGSASGIDPACPAMPRPPFRVD